MWAKVMRPFLPASHISISHTLNIIFTLFWFSTATDIYVSHSLIFECDIHLMYFQMSHSCIFEWHFHSPLSATFTYYLWTLHSLITIKCHIVESPVHSPLSVTTVSSVRTGEGGVTEVTGWAAGVGVTPTGGDFGMSAVGAAAALPAKNKQKSKIS